MLAESIITKKRIVILLLFSSYYIINPVFITLSLQRQIMASVMLTVTFVTPTNSPRKGQRTETL
jgi:hypothetical protein